MQADLPGSNFGTVAAVKVDGSPVTVSYLKFDVQGLTGAPASATLKVFVPVSTTTPINVRSVADSSWTETGLTFANRPATGATAIASPAPIAANTTVSFDVTALVAGSGPVSFALDTTSITSKSLPSREASANQPQLDGRHRGRHHHAADHAADERTTPRPAGAPFGPVADSYVQADLPARNFGTAAALKVDGSPVTVSYLKFDVQGITGAPTRATLKVFLPVTTTTAINARSTANTLDRDGVHVRQQAGDRRDGHRVGGADRGEHDGVVRRDLAGRPAGAGVVRARHHQHDQQEPAEPGGDARTSRSSWSRRGWHHDADDDPAADDHADEHDDATRGDSVAMAVGGDVACGITEANYNGGAGPPRRAT